MHYAVVWCVRIQKRGEGKWEEGAWKRKVGGAGLEKEECGRLFNGWAAGPWTSHGPLMAPSHCLPASQPHSSACKAKGSTCERRYLFPQRTSSCVQNTSRAYKHCNSLTHTHTYGCLCCVRRMSRQVEAWEHSVKKGFRKRHAVLKYSYFAFKYIFIKPPNVVFRRTIPSCNSPGECLHVALPRSSFACISVCRLECVCWMTCVREQERVCEVMCFVESLCGRVREKVSYCVCAHCSKVACAGGTCRIFGC